MKETGPFRPESSVMLAIRESTLKSRGTEQGLELFRTGSRIGKSNFRTLSLSVSKETTGRIRAMTYEERNWERGVELTEGAKANVMSSTEVLHNEINVV